MKTATAVMVAAMILGGGQTLLAAELINADFETGDLGGWTTFVTSNGSIGGSYGLPVAESFDTTGEGASYGAKFQVGQVASSPGVYAGGGIYQDVELDAGYYLMTVDVAAYYATGNSEFGRFELLIDGVVADSVTFGTSWDNGTTFRDSLSAYLTCTGAETHEVRIRITRSRLIGPALGQSPFQYVDNVTLVSVPEPATMALMGFGVLGFIVFRRKW